MRISDWSSDVCSSDLVSTNADVTQVLRWGTMRGLVAGTEAVLPDGWVYDGLAVLKKDNRGYDWIQLLICGEGTLATVIDATLRLDRKNVVEGKSVYARGDSGGTTHIKKTQQLQLED